MVPFQELRQNLNRSLRVMTVAQPEPTEASSGPALKRAKRRALLAGTAALGLALGAAWHFGRRLLFA